MAPLSFSTHLALEIQIGSFLLLSAPVECSLMEQKQGIDAQLAEAVIFVAQRYFSSRCLQFLYSNMSSIRDVTFGNILASLHQKWSVFLPCHGRVGFQRESLQPKDPGVTSHLYCAYIIVIRGIDYVQEVKSLMYSTWNTLYVESDPTGLPLMVVAVERVINRGVAYTLLRTMADMGDLDVVIIGEEDGAIRVFSYFPFGKDGQSCPNGNLEVVLLDTWNGMLRNNVFPNKVPKVFKGCTLSVAGVDHEPYLFKNKRDVFEGIDYNVLQVIAGHLNLTLNISRYFQRADGWLFQVTEDTFYGSIYELREGNVWVHVTFISNNPFHCNTLLIKSPYLYTSAMLFCTNPLPVDSWKLLYLAFSDLLWCLFLIVLIIFPILIFFLNKTSINDQYYQSYMNCILFCFSSAVSNTVGLSPKTTVLRILFAVWFYYTVHINNAYTASLTGLLSSVVLEPKIKTPEDMFNRNWSLLLRVYERDGLNAYENSSVKLLLRNVRFALDHREALAYMLNYRNSCFSDLESFMDYQIVGNKLSLYKSSIKMSNMRSLGVAMRKNHYLMETVDKIVQRIISGGINIKFIKDYNARLSMTDREMEFTPMTVKSLSGPFYLLMCGLLVASVVFFVEWIIIKSKSYSRIVHWIHKYW